MLQYGPPVPQASPTVRRRRLTAELRRLRTHSGRTIDEVADRVGISKSSLSRIENGVVGLKIPVLRALLAEYGVEGEAALRLEHLCRDASKRGWWQLDNRLSLDVTDTAIGLEAEASAVDDFSLTIVTGLLQTEEYAQAVIRAIAVDPTEDEVAAAVAVRLRRQERLDDIRLWSILAEETLVRPVGSAAVMRAQVEHLVELSRRSRVTLQILPLSAGPHPGLAGGFFVLRFGPQDTGAVYLEGALSDSCLEDVQHVLDYSTIFDRLRAIALSPDDSRRHLELRARELS